MEHLRWIHDRRSRTVALAVFNLILNLLYAFYNGILGIRAQSVLFGTSCVYYFLLSSMRFSAVFVERKKVKEIHASRVIGILLIMLSMIFAVLLFFSLPQNNAAVYGTIPMITIATYTFTKITIAVVKAVKRRGNPSYLMRAVDMIRYAEIAVSLLTMQRSMLVSFGGTPGKGTMILNIFTGTNVCLFILFLGIYTIYIHRKEN